MNIYYAKTVLYAYPVIDEVVEQIDELVEKKAYSSMNDFSPAINQCNKIVEYTVQKSLLFLLKACLDSTVTRLNQDETDLLDYKYFKKKPKSYYENFDYTSRQYFRRQNRVIEKVADILEKKGFTDAKFEKEYLSIKFIKELFKRVIEYEKTSNKNKKKEKQTAENKNEVA